MGTLPWLCLTHYVVEFVRSFALCALVLLAHPTFGGDGPIVVLEPKCTSLVDGKIESVYDMNSELNIKEERPDLNHVKIDSESSS